MKPAVVVTGASSGIGRALVSEAARDAAAIVLIGLSAQELTEVAGEVAPADTHVLAIDLAHPDAGGQVEQFLAARGLYCDVLINSAGFGLYGLAAEGRRDEQLKLIDVNARSVTELTLRFLPGMLQRRRGGVINVASITSYMAGPYMALYFASKAFVRSFTTALASEVAGSGVTVTCLVPGVTRTPFFAHCPADRTLLFKLMPRSNATDVAAAGWRGFKAGKRLVVPRLADRLVIASCALLPDWALLRLIATLHRPHQDAGER